MAKKRSKGPLSDIAGRIKKGALRKKAQAAGQSTQAFAQAHKHDSGKTGMQSRLAITFAKHRPGKRTKGRRTSR
jgi:hypothetical protein